MKKITIGNEEFNQMATAEEIGVKRFVELKKFIMQKHTGVPIDSLTEFFKGFLKAFDDNSKSEMLIKCYNYFNGLQEIQEGFDANQYIFALITNRPDEDINSVSNDLLKEKIEHFAKLGLTQGEATAAAENFMENSTILSNYYSLMSSLSNSQQA